MIRWYLKDYSCFYIFLIRVSTKTRRCSHSSKVSFAVCYARYDEGALNLKNSRVFLIGSVTSVFRISIHAYIEYIIYLSACTKPTIRLELLVWKKIFFFFEKILNSLSITNGHFNLCSFFLIFLSRSNNCYFSMKMITLRICVQKQSHWIFVTKAISSVRETLYNNLSDNLSDHISDWRSRTNADTRYNVFLHGFYTTF